MAHSTLSHIHFVHLSTPPPNPEALPANDEAGKRFDRRRSIVAFAPIDSTHPSRPSTVTILDGRPGVPNSVEVSVSDGLDGKPQPILRDDFLSVCEVSVATSGAIALVGERLDANHNRVYNPMLHISLLTPTGSNGKGGTHFVERQVATGRNIQSLYWDSRGSALYFWRTAPDVTKNDIEAQRPNVKWQLNRLSVTPDVEDQTRLEPVAGAGVESFFPYPLSSDLLPWYTVQPSKQSSQQSSDSVPSGILHIRRLSNGPEMTYPISSTETSCPNYVPEFICWSGDSKFVAMSWTGQPGLFYTLLLQRASKQTIDLNQRIQDELSKRFDVDKEQIDLPLIRNLKALGHSSRFLVYFRPPTPPSDLGGGVYDSPRNHPDYGWIVFDAATGEITDVDGLPKNSVPNSQILVSPDGRSLQIEGIVGYFAIE